MPDDKAFGIEMRIINILAAHDENHCSFFVLSVDVERRHFAGTQACSGERKLAAPVCGIAIHETRAAHAECNGFPREHRCAFVAVEDSPEARRRKLPVRVVAVIDTALGVGEAVECLAAAGIAILHVEVINRLPAGAAIEQELCCGAGLCGAQREEIPCSTAQYQCATYVLPRLVIESQRIRTRGCLCEVMEHRAASHKLRCAIKRYCSRARERTRIHPAPRERNAVRI